MVETPNMDSFGVVANEVKPHNLLDVATKVFFFFIGEAVDHRVDAVVYKYPLSVHKELE